MMNRALFRSTFREKNLRLSHARFLIYQELVGAGIALSPLELYQVLRKKQRKVGLTSIYRALDLFESLGMVFKISNGSNTKYRLCEMKSHHHHIVCKACGDVRELGFCEIADWSRKVMELTGYQVTDHLLDFYGYCKDCKPLQTDSGDR